MPSGIQRLSRGLVLDAATTVLSRNGVAGLSMRKLATELGTGPMSIYVYFQTKEQLLDAVADAGLAGIELAIDEQACWQDQLMTSFTSLERGLERRPEIRELLITRSVQGPSVDELRETVIAILRAAGFTPAEALHVLATLYSFTLGYLATAHRAGDTTAFNQLDRERFPNLAEAIADYGHRAAASVYTDGLRHLIDGFAAKR